MPNNNFYKDREILVSVIIPIYNTAPYINNCLDSILGNTYKELQIICVNDGSNDGSLEILQEYGKNDSRILIINKPNGGVCSARNAGLKEAKGDYISFVDSDDVILESYYETLMKIMIENNADIIDCQKSASLHDDDDIGDISILNNYGIVKNKAMRTYVAGKIYKKTTIRNCHFKESLVLGEDRVFNLDVIKMHISKNHELNGIFVNKPMYCYASRSGSATHLYSYEKAKPSIDYLQEIANNEINVDLATIYRFECIREYLIAWYSLYLLGDKKGAKKVSHELRTMAKGIRKNNVYSWKEAFPFVIFAYVPRLYRIFRIIDDPTMKQFEKNVRKNNTNSC